MKLTCSMISTEEDENNNTTYTFTISGKLLFPTINESTQIFFNIYEKDLLCIIFSYFVKEMLLVKWL